MLGRLDCRVVISLGPVWGWEESLCWSEARAPRRYPLTTCDGLGLAELRCWVHRTQRHWAAGVWPDLVHETLVTLGCSWGLWAGDGRHIGCGDHSGYRRQWEAALHLLLQDGLSAGELPHGDTGRHADVHAKISLFLSWLFISVWLGIRVTGKHNSNEIKRRKKPYLAF